MSLDLPYLLRLHGTTTSDRAADEIERLRAQVILLERQFGEYVERFLSDVECTNDKLRRYKKALMETTASLAAAISLLERGRKKAAPSNKMFDQMILDYKKSLDAARAILNPE
jgi:hypothetical protein